MKFRNNRLLLLSAALLLAMATPLSYAHAWQQERQSNQAQPIEPDQIEQLGLTPDQRQRIRLIFEQQKEERQATTRRIREANIALNQALDAEQIDESLIDQRINDLSAAQAAQMRLRIRTELRIRRELRPEQLAILRRLRLRARAVMGGQRPLNRRATRPGQRQNQPNIVIPRRNSP
jgi:Spy/CpxP family protein refolding chaperone